MTFRQIIASRSFQAPVLAAMILLGCFVCFHFVLPAPAAPIETRPVISVPEPEPVPVEAPLTWREGRFEGKPFYNRMLDLGLEAGRIHTLIDVLTPYYDFRRSHPRHRWRMASLDGKPVRFELHTSPAHIFDVTGLDGKMEAAQRPIETVTEPTVVRAELNNSLYASLAHFPENANLAMKLSSVFAYEIDFYQDPRKGDEFELLVEQIFVRGEDGLQFNKWGRVLAAQYRGKQNTYHAYYFDDGKDSGYYDQAGKSLIRDVLRSPLKLQRITSSFKKRRFHPILKRYKPHNGVDYGVPKGTPVMAVANGRVVRAGRHGGAGIMVELKHRKEMITHYLHLSNIAKGVRKGSRVKQGQVIGYVGKTGLATSYHLHFGMKIRGKYVNPLRQKFQPGPPIDKKHATAFASLVEHYSGELAGITAPLETAPLVRNPGILHQYLPKKSRLGM